MDDAEVVQVRQALHNLREEFQHALARGLGQPAAELRLREPRRQGDAFAILHLLDNHHLVQRRLRARRGVRHRGRRRLLGLAGPLRIASRRRGPFEAAIGFDSRTSCKRRDRRHRFEAARAPDLGGRRAERRAAVQPGRQVLGELRPILDVPHHVRAAQRLELPEHLRPAPSLVVVLDGLASAHPRRDQLHSVPFLLNNVPRFDHHAVASAPKVLPLPEGLREMTALQGPGERGVRWRCRVRRCAP
mmetsp:Transcript_48322/g.146996  ORF Transcript_48322/g.146996 Transcript_48322/m.146996 type:complete len:246 (-) Transcript_48322:138-875(-)